jgi:hypothetical protein
MTDAFAFPFVDGIPSAGTARVFSLLTRGRVPKALLLTATAIASLLH